ncbi:hypothetical protein EVAR_98363_1 [Eumeta japonica]|uniref:Uncharacterized protein n=1 Tax=Eumeta variegata TaxID=151549 RepID=A0A4C2A7B5_EUMVA|nr:hypothetical protein EVAR_98363_1 [Eumeta japonica]
MSAAILKGAPCKHRITRRVSETVDGTTPKAPRTKTNDNGRRSRYLRRGVCDTRREMDDVARVVRSLDNVGMSILRRGRVFVEQENFGTKVVTSGTRRRSRTVNDQWPFLAYDTEGATSVPGRPEPPSTRPPATATEITGGVQITYVIRGIDDYNEYKIAPPKLGGWINATRCMYPGKYVRNR